MTVTIMSKVFNYKQKVESVEVDERQSLNDDLYPCGWENLVFCDTDHDQTTAGDVSLYLKPIANEMSHLECQF